MKTLTEEKSEELLNVIMSYARLDFSTKAKIQEDGSTIDALSAGVNMLGEELESSMLSLKEKERLLKEIHHRVKNNMQIISSMMRLHCNLTDDEELANMVEECQTRISAMALIHEMLYASSDFKHTKLEDYVVKLCESLKRSYLDTNNTIQVLVDIPDDIFMDIDRLIPLGLIINESVCNSFKHAFPSGEGTVIINSEKLDNEECIIEVGDNGIGLPEDFDHNNINTLGMQLIFMLSEQLSAEITQINKRGLYYHIRL